MADRSTEEIQAEIAAARQRLASNIEGLITQAHPRAILVRGLADAKGFFQQEASSAKAQFVATDGSVKTERVAYLAAAVVGSIALLAILKSLTSKK